MSDLKNDSVLVLKLILIICGFFMVFFSKLGYYLLILLIALGWSILYHIIFKIPFLNHYMLTVIIGTVVFEMVYPRYANFTKTIHLEIKEEYDNAKNELMRRRTGIKKEQ